MPPIHSITSTLQADAMPVAPSINDIVTDFLEIFERIRIHPLNDQFQQSGRQLLQQKLIYFIENQLPIEIVLPAFPCKSPNAVNKVLGKLPDRGEELALARLEQFCCDIERVYPPGAYVVIFSDGRVFNDLLGVSTNAVNMYKHALLEMALQCNHKHIRFDALENYTSTETPILEIMERFEMANVNITEKIKKDDNLRNTYCGFISFLTKDLEQQLSSLSKTKRKKICGQVAKQMLYRNMAFSALVDEQYSRAIRFSIHAHNNAGQKLGIHLLPVPQQHQPRTPWHSVIVEDDEGTIQVLHLSDIDPLHHKVQIKKGQKWSFLKL